MSKRPDESESGQTGCRYLKQKQTKTLKSQEEAIVNKHRGTKIPEWELSVKMRYLKGDFWVNWKGEREK